jgi:GT2 family glycosyltransferase
MLESRVFAIVVTYNGESWIEKCIKSLKESIIPVSVIVVDNCSVDNTKTIVQTQFPECFLIESNVNLGFGKANNLGISYAIENGADYVFLLNQDAWIESDTLKALLTTFKREKKFGVLSPIHLDGKGEKLDLNFLSYMEESKTPGFLSDAVLGRLKESYETSFVNAAAWLVSRNCMLQVGGFDPVFPHYGEDDDYIKRAIFHGYKVGITNCYIYHDRVIKRKEGEQDLNELNVNRLHILNLLVLKNLHKPFYLNVISFFRRNLIKSIHYFLDFKFKEIFYLLKAGLKTTLVLVKANKSYKISKDGTKLFFS